MLKSLIKLRQAAARSGLGRFARKLGVHHVFDSALDRMAQKGGPLVIEIAGRAVRFRPGSRLEAARISEAVGEREHLESLCAELRENDVFYDIGANLGMFSCAIGVLGGQSVQVHAFEPEPGTAGRLRENARINGLNNVRVHQIALSDKDGSFDLLVAENVRAGGSHSLVSGHVDGARVRPVRIEAHPAKSYAERESIPAPTIVKCDVEGAEGAVLRGLAPWLSEGRIRRLDVEFHPETLKKQGESVDALERDILSRGYRTASSWSRGDTVNKTFMRSE